MSETVIPEAVASTLTLTADQATALSDIGRSLRGSIAFWGADDADEDAESRSTVISVYPRGGDTYDVRPHNVIGVVGLPGLQLVIEPKIPRSHIFHLMRRTSPTFRPALSKTLVAADESLKELVATWYLDEVDDLLRYDLLRDYNPRQDNLPVIRGSVLVLPTTRNLLGGKLRAECRYEEFEQDTPLNRVLLEALRLVVIDESLSDTTRRRARRAAARFDRVGPMRSGDLAAADRPLERRAVRYAPPMHLARLILGNAAVTPDTGRVLGRTFVVPTAPLVESAIRNILTANLACPVEKRSALAPVLAPRTGTASFDPDLVIDRGRIVGDVKYRISRSADWVSPERNQLLAFAAAFSASKAVVIGFACDSDHTAPALRVGASNPVEIYAINWRCSEEQDPELSESEVVDALLDVIAE